MKEITKRFTEEDLKGKMSEELFNNEVKIFPDRFPYIKGKKYYDVSSVTEFQLADCDVLFYPSGVEKTSPIDILKERHWLDKLNAGENIYTFYEIKTDGRVNETKNLLYEVIKHDKPGRLAKSIADVLVYIPVSQYHPYKLYNYYWVINMFKLRKYVRETLSDEFQQYVKLTRCLAHKIEENKDSDIESLQSLAKKILEFKFSVIPYNFEKREIKPEVYKKMTDEEKESIEIDGKILNLWVNIDKLVELGIAEKHEILTPVEDRTRIENKWNEKIKDLKQNGTL